MNKKFEDYMLQKNDEIDNAAYALAAALIRTSPEQTNEEVLEWDIDLISSITSAAIGELKKLVRTTAIPLPMINRHLVLGATIAKTRTVLTKTLLLQKYYPKRSKKNETVR